MTSPAALVMQALGAERPVAALAGLHHSPRVVRLLRELFVVALRRCFGGHEVREITTYVRDLLLWLDLPAGGELARQTEGLIRATLGEPALAAGVRPACRFAIMCAVVGDLSRPPGVGPEALAELIAQAEQRVDRLDPIAPRRRPTRRIRRR
jgi:hypothetical protein